MKALSVKQAYSKKFKKFEFEGIWKEVFGNPETTGGWIIHGDEKQGKSTFALMLANYLTKFGKVLYISAEEGISEHFTGAMKRMGINDTNKNFKFLEVCPVGSRLCRMHGKLIFCLQVMLIVSLIES